MAAAPPPAPNEFSEHLARWVYNKTLPSVVLVTFDPINVEEVKDHLQTLSPGESEVVRKGNANKRRRIGAQNRCATGFVVQEAPGHLLVLTCAHPLDHVFTDAKPITREEINTLFRVQILCDHAETRFRHHQVAVRRSVPARVVQLDCKLDLLLLRVEQAALTQWCQEPHPAVPIADNFPESLSKVVVVSWPPYRPQTRSLGFTSHEGRDYLDVFPTNDLGYTMSLSEVNILMDGGSSGAPMLNGVASAVGVLHGGSQSSLCYFTSLPDLREALTDWGVIGNADE